MKEHFGGGGGGGRKKLVLSLSLSLSLSFPFLFFNLLIDARNNRHNLEFIYSEIFIRFSHEHGQLGDLHPNERCNRNKELNRDFPR